MLLLLSLLLDDYTHRDPTSWYSRLLKTLNPCNEVHDKLGSVIHVNSRSKLCFAGAISIFKYFLMEYSIFKINFMIRVHYYISSLT